MGFLLVDDARCIGDRLCEAACPVKIVRFDEERRRPFVTERDAGRCIACGHCVAVCPTAAVSNERVRLEECEELDGSLVLDGEAARRFLFSRRSVRNYKPRPVEREDLERLVKAAAWAAAGGNRRPWGLVVCDGPERLGELGRMAMDWIKVQADDGDPEDGLTKRFRRLVKRSETGLDPVLLNAPVLITIHAPMHLANHQVNCALAMGYIELTAHARGLGSCYVGYFNNALNAHEPLKKALEIPAGHRAAATLVVGWPRYRYLRVPPRPEPRVRWL